MSEELGAYRGNGFAAVGGPGVLATILIRKPSVVADHLRLARAVAVQQSQAERNRVHRQLGGEHRIRVRVRLDDRSVCRMQKQRDSTGDGTPSGDREAR